MDKRMYQRIVAERRQLENRIDKLRIFFVTETFAKLSNTEKGWLRDQLNAMKWYHHILCVRIEYYSEKEVREDGRPFTEDPAK